MLGCDRGVRRAHSPGGFDENIMSMSHNEAVSILKVCYKNLSGFGVDRPVFRPAENPGSGIQTHVDSSNMAYGEITYAGMEHL